MTRERECRVSVVLTAFNLARFVGSAVESVLSQTFHDFELIAVDDGSSDGTAEILDAFRDARLRVIHQVNAGAAEALNTGLRLARGDYVALLDGDDRWRPNKLRTHLEYLEAHPGADVTFCRSTWIDEQGREIGLQSRRCQGTFNFGQLLEDYAIGNTSAVVLRRATLVQAGYCNPHWRICKDADLVLRIALQRPDNVHAIPRTLTEYRRHGAQVSRNWQELRSEWDELIREFERITAAVTRRVARRSRSNMVRYCAFLAYEAGDFREAARNLWAAFHAAPGPFLVDPRNWSMSAGVAAAVLLPSVVHHGLERMAGVTLAPRPVQREPARTTHPPSSVTNCRV
jgi:glycosyltransferase involved in cell wall biosynthesis